MRYLAAFFTVTFILFAVVQYNDPDPYLWIPIYGYAALMSYLAYRQKYITPALVIGLIGYLVGTIYYFPPSVGDWINAEETAKSLQMKMPFVEEARESMGLAICVIAMGIFLYAAYRQRKTQPSPVSKTV
jgi:hypothetical protein